VLIVAAIGFLGALAGLFAVQFKDRNENLRVVADFIEQTKNDPKGQFESVRQKLVALLPKDQPSDRTLARETPSESERPASSVTPPESRLSTTNPTPSRVPESAAPRQSADASPPVVDSVAPEPAKRDVAPTPTTPVRGADDAGAALRDENVRTLTRRVEQLEEQVKEAARSAQEAQSAARAAGLSASTEEKRPTVDEGSYVNALEGRIDELADEIKALRDRLNSPKNETRLEPEPAQAHAPAAAPTKASGTAGELVVVAQALSLEIEKGRPFAIEQSALTALGADPALLAMLAPSAEKGAPTAAQLREAFSPVARRLRALEQPATDGSFLDRMTTGVKKLVKIRRKDQPAVDVIDETATKIDDALRHSDVEAAVSAFETLPDNAKEEAKSFGEALIHRRDAEKAAASLLTGAIAALGHAKN
jgi:chaperonin cofactor prefoldin